jgi:hypothetical protein
LPPLLIVLHCLQVQIYLFPFDNASVTLTIKNSECFKITKITAIKHD